MANQNTQSMLPMYDQFGYPVYNKPPIYNPQPSYNQQQNYNNIPTQMVSNYNYQPVAPTVPTNQQRIFCRPVTSEDEAKGALIELDGSLYIFTNLKQGIIYTKQLENDGTAPLRKYILTAGNSQEQVSSQEFSAVPAQNPIDLDNYVLKTDFETLYKMYDDVSYELQALSKDFDDYVASNSKQTKSKKSSVILEGK